MRRNIEKDLVEWKNQGDCNPLIIRGARQVGKTYLIENFGKKYFTNFVTVNFEYQPRLKMVFNSLNPMDILNRLELIFKTEIVPGESLLFLDEIQECPAAILALRYFKEKLPNLHVIGAGSLLEFILNSPDFRMPVGRVSFLHLYPFSFGEFLEACGNSRLRDYLANINLADKIDPVIHDECLQLLKQYCFLGGMPAVLKSYIKNKNFLKSQNILSTIIEGYRNDFGKYSKRTNYTLLQHLFEKVPQLVGERFKYAKVSHEARSREIKHALKLLNQAGLVTHIYASSGSGLPLGALINERKFKILFLDVGLLQRACGLDEETFLQDDLLKINAGAVAEQFVGQEIISQGNPYQKKSLFFWVRDKKYSEAEVDFLFATSNQIFPIEVKSGKTGTLKSLRTFINDNNLPFGIRVSESPLSLYGKVLAVPLYMVEQLPRLVKEAAV